MENNAKKISKNTRQKKNNSVDVYELFEVDNSFHDDVIRLANAFGAGIAEVLERLNGSVNAFASVAKGIAGSLELYEEFFKNLKELEGVRPPSEIKKELKHEKNPMRIMQLNRELTESYKRYRRK